MRYDPNNNECSKTQTTSYNNNVAASTRVAAYRTMLRL